MSLLRARVDYLRVGRPPRAVLETFALSLDPGDFVVVTGGTGSGKSLLARLLVGALGRSRDLDVSASLSYADGPATAGPPPVGFLGYVGPDPRSQLVGSTLLEDVCLGPGCLGGHNGGRDLRSHGAAVLAAVGLAGYEDRHPETLSGGEAQRAALAAALSAGPPVLVLDEALSELDPSGRRVVLSLLRSHAGEGGAVVLMSADAGEALGFADRCIDLGDGAQVREWRPPPGEDPPGAGAVVAHGLTHAFPGGRGCLGIDLTVDGGELVGIVGPNGSGKTTFVRRLLGLARPQAGTLAVLGVDPAGRRGHRVRRRMAVVPQDPDLRVCRPALVEEIALDAEIRGRPPAEARRWAMDVLCSVGLEGRADDHPLRLSRGERRLAGGALACALGAEIVVADEPVAGLPGRQAAAIYSRLRDAADAGAAVIVVSHEHAGLEAVADRKISMAWGRIVAEERAGAVPVRTAASSAS